MSRESGGRAVSGAVAGLFVLAGIILFMAPGAASLSRNRATPLWSEDFESADAAGRWRFSNGPEFPGASGAFKVVASPVHGGKRAGRLDFDFRKGGSYVETQTLFPAAVAGEGVSFWASLSVPGAEIRLRIVDETNQTFQSRFHTPFPAEWTEYHVRVGDFEESWGGAGDGVIHGALKGLSVVLVRGSVRYPKGALSIDDLRIVSSGAAEVDPFGADALPAARKGRVSDFVGVQSNFITHFPLDTKQLDLAKAAGFGFVRGPLAWERVEKSTGRYDFSAWDELVQEAGKRGLGSYLILSENNPLYYDGPGAYDYKWGPRTAAARLAFAAFGREAARHFAGRDVVLEIWNEPNIANFWHPAPDARLYGLLAAETAAAIKNAGLKTPIIAGAIATIDLPFLESLARLGGLKRADAVSVHPYRPSNPETFFVEFAPAEKAVGADAGRPGLPFWAGEWGYSSTWFGGRTAAAYRKQALYVIRLLLTCLERRVPRTVLYNLKDDGDDPADLEHNFGLLRNRTLAAKPGYQAVKAFRDLQPSGVVSIGSIDTHDRCAYGLLIRRGGAKLAALWTDRPGREAVLLVPDRAGMKAYSMFGFPLALGKSGGRRVVRLSEDKGPVYLRLG
jgi:hypothetical protein